MDRITEESSFENFYKGFQMYLKYTGLFPTESFIQKDSRKKAIFNIRYISTEPFASLSKLQAFLYGVVTILSCIRLIKCIFVFKVPLWESLNLLVWCGSCLCGFSFAMKFVSDGCKICSLIERCIRVEEEIEGIYGSRFPIQGRKKHHNEYRFFIASKVFVMTSMGISAFTLMYNDPESPIFMLGCFSLGSGQLSFFAGAVFEFLVQFYLWGYGYFFFILILSVSHTVERCLDTIYYDDERYQERIFPDEIHNQANESIEFFHKLERIVEDMNNTVGVVLMLNLFGSLVISCFCFYLPFKYGKSMAYPLILIHMISFGVIIILCIRVYPVLGIVYDKSIGFKRSWIKGVALHSKGGDRDSENDQELSSPKLLLKLKCCYPFGFTVGGFFIIRTFTMFTCLSVLSTYIIFMLQFGL